MDFAASGHRHAGHQRGHRTLPQGREGSAQGGTQDARILRSGPWQTMARFVSASVPEQVTVIPSTSDGLFQVAFGLLVRGRQRRPAIP